MKKIVVLLALLALFSGFTCAYSEGTELPYGSYVVGKDIPAGVYTFSGVETGNENGVSVNVAFTCYKSLKLGDYASFTITIREFNGSFYPATVVLEEGCLLISDAPLSYLYLGAFDESNGEATAFTALPGIYTCGTDFPAGRYTISCAPSSVSTTISVFDVDGDLLISEVIDSDSEKKIGLFEFSSGYNLKVSKGNARFDVYSGEGIVFD